LHQCADARSSDNASTNRLSGFDVTRLPDEEARLIHHQRVTVRKRTQVPGLEAKLSECRETGLKGVLVFRSSTGDRLYSQLHPGVIGLADIPHEQILVYAVRIKFNVDQLRLGECLRDRPSTPGSNPRYRQMKTAIPAFQTNSVIVVAIAGPVSPNR
jgi:hypothetical protein